MTLASYHRYSIRPEAKQQFFLAMGRDVAGVLQQAERFIPERQVLIDGTAIVSAR